jgi:phosphoribosylformylglycinamidine cyclo-ligase
MLRGGLRIKALAHITSTGFLNLVRGDADVSYVLDALPEPPPIFQMIQKSGDVPDEEMFFTYNMGIGFCIVAAPEDADAILGVAKKHSVDGWIIGHTEPSQTRKAVIPSRGLVGKDGAFSRV